MSWGDLFGFLIAGILGALILALALIRIAGKKAPIPSTSLTGNGEVVPVPESFGELWILRRALRVLITKRPNREAWISDADGLDAMRYELKFERFTDPTGYIISLVDETPIGKG